MAFTPEQIAQLEQGGHWPPPIGIRVLERAESSPLAVAALLRTLRKIVSPPQRKYIDVAISRLLQDSKLSHL